MLRHGARWPPGADRHQTPLSPPDRAARPELPAVTFEERLTMARIEVKSEITGTVWQVKSKAGDKVESGDTLIVIESMKMEIPVITEDSGTVKEILVKEKDPVSEGQVVAVPED
jgi:acetyl-CoA carboxylase biotin carboxyl carrier protein